MAEGPCVSSCEKAVIIALRLLNKKSSYINESLILVIFIVSRAILAGWKDEYQQEDCWLNAFTAIG